MDPFEGKTAEQVLGKERIEYERSKHRPAKRTRLTLDDFQAIGVNIQQELWEGLQRIEDPVVYMKNFFEMLAFVAPKVNTIDIQHEVNSTGDAPKIDFSTMRPQDLVELMRDSKKD